LDTSEKIHVSRLGLFRSKSDLDLSSIFGEERMTTPQVKAVLQEAVSKNPTQNDVLDPTRSFKKKRRLRVAKIHFQESDEEVAEKILEVICATSILSVLTIITIFILDSH
jgi:hypothetical protein